MKFCEKCEIGHEKNTCPVCEAKRELKLKDQQIVQLLNDSSLSLKQKEKLTLEFLKINKELNS